MVRIWEIGAVVAENGVEKIKLSSKQSHEYDIWAMQYFPYGTTDKQHKLSGLATVEKGQMPQQVGQRKSAIPVVFAIRVYRIFRAR